MLRARARPREARAARRVAVDGRVRGAAGARRAHAARARDPPRRPRGRRPTWAAAAARAPRGPSPGRRPAARAPTRPRARGRRGRGGGRARRAPARVRGRRDELAVGAASRPPARADEIAGEPRGGGRRCSSPRPTRPRACAAGRAARARASCARRRRTRSRPTRSSCTSRVHVPAAAHALRARADAPAACLAELKNASELTHVARALLGLDPRARARAARAAALLDGVARGGGGELGDDATAASTSLARARHHARLRARRPRAERQYREFLAARAANGSSPAPPDATAAAPRDAAAAGARRRLPPEPEELRATSTST